MTDLLPHLIDTPKNPVLVPQFMPQSFIEFLKQANFEVRILHEETVQVERLYIPEMELPEWNSEKIKKIQTFFENFIPKNLTQVLLVQYQLIEYMFHVNWQASDTCQTRTNLCLC